MWDVKGKDMFVPLWVGYGQGNVRNDSGLRAGHKHISKVTNWGTGEATEETYMAP